jgi:hypothetical protein
MRRTSTTSYHTVRRRVSLYSIAVIPLTDSAVILSTSCAVVSIRLAMITKTTVLLLLLNKLTGIGRAVEALLTLELC